MNINDDVIEMLMKCHANGYSLVSQYDKSNLDRLVNSSDSEVRAWTAKALVADSDNSIALYYLRQLANDPDSNVRVEAIDSLSEYHNTESLQVLSAALSDSDYLVRGYAAFGVAYVGSHLSPLEAKDLLLHVENIETDQFVLVAIYEGLYLLGCYSYLDKLIAQFQSEDYHIQCAVLHSLEEILDVHNVNQVRIFLNSINRAKYPNSVVDRVELLDMSVIQLSNNNVH